MRVIAHSIETSSSSEVEQVEYLGLLVDFLKIYLKSQCSFQKY